MDKNPNVTEQLNELIGVYDFNADTLSKYLGLPAEQLERLSQGHISFLPEEPAYRFRLFNKISFLYFSAVADKDLKLCAFLKVLLSYHNLSKKTIAKIAGVDVKDIERLLSDPPKETPEAIKYKIAAAVMALRFFLKDCEPEQQADV